MQKPTNSLKIAAEKIIQAVIQCEDRTVFKVPQFSQDLQIDPRRVSEVCVVLEAARWLYRSGRDYVYEGRDKFQQNYDKLITEITTKNQAIDFKSDNIQLSLCILQLLNKGYRGSCAQIAQKIGYITMQRRINDILTVLEKTKIVLTDSLTIQTYSFNQDFSYRDFFPSLVRSVVVSPEVITLNNGKLPFSQEGVDTPMGQHALESLVLVQSQNYIAEKLPESSKFWQSQQSQQQSQQNQWYGVVDTKEE